MLHPLPPGQHMIRLTVIEDGPIFWLAEHDVTHHITVKPGSKK